VPPAAKYPRMSYLLLVTAPARIRANKKAALPSGPFRIFDPKLFSTAPQSSLTSVPSVVYAF
jgi:hypothetical protein